MKKLFNLMILSLFVIFGFFFLSCNQDSIFYDISHEPEPRDPIISGGPTNMAVVRGQVFVGPRMSSSVFAYGYATGDLRWAQIPSPGGFLGELATDGQHLYALIFPNGDPLRSSIIRRFNVFNMAWESSVSLSGYSIQTIFGAGNNIFAGVQSNTNRNRFAIAHYNTSTSSIRILEDGTSLLTGAADDASGNVYLATAGSGIYLFRGDNVTGPITGTSSANLSGIKEVGGSIIAVGSNGAIYIGSSGQFTSASVGVNFTGAMSVWYDPANAWRPSLLLLGIRSRGTSRNQGYREMVLIQGRPTFDIKFPGDGLPSSVSNRARYSASVGRHPIEAILQVPDVSNGGPINYRSFASIPGWEPPIFASTSRHGLWSYRNGEWNAED